MKNTEKIENIFFLCLLFVFFLHFLFACVVDCQSLPRDYGQRNTCFRKKAIDEKNEKICENIDDEIMRDYWCYRELAYIKKDIKICEKIEILEARESCEKILTGEEIFERGIRE